MSGKSKCRSDGGTVIAIYRVSLGKEQEFEQLLERHHPTLLQLELVKEERPRVYRNLDEKGRSTYYEIFEWKDAKAAGGAHENPEVMAVWDAMGKVVEERDGLPKYEFPHVQPITLSCGG
ncbi:MAG: hypothetical protein ACI8X5_003123 [Planctomycetota bacterium]|jgi:hypothetical protein